MRVIFDGIVIGGIAAILACQLVIIRLLKLSVDWQELLWKQGNK